MSGKLSKCIHDDVKLAIIKRVLKCVCVNYVPHLDLHNVVVYVMVVAPNQLDVGVIILRALKCHFHRQFVALHDQEEPEPAWQSVVTNSSTPLELSPDLKQ